MPMKLNVGISRKVTDNNYGSRGGSINLEMELDSQFTSEPAKLHEKIRQLFGMARTALAEELNGHAAPSPATNGRALPARESAPRPATPSQIKALHAIAQAHDVNLAEFLYETFRIRRADDLNLQQASQAIDALKSTGFSTAS